jgi:hypothetical protein
MKLRVGQTLTSPVDATSLVVVRAPTDDVAVTCGGASMVPKGEAPPPGAAPAGGAGGGLVLGKRYADEALGIELLCVKGGDHAVAVNGTTLVQKSAKPLPASD